MADRKFTQIAFSFEPHLFSINQLTQASSSLNFNWNSIKFIKIHNQYHLSNINYVYIEKVDEFAKKAADRLLHFHYYENKNVMVVCNSGRKIGLLVLIYYLSSLCHISRQRAYEIIKTKLPLFTLDSAISRYIT